jgi:hypothetical protein
MVFGTSLDGGHYVCVVRNARTGAALLYDDLAPEVVELDGQRLDFGNAYMAAYQLVDTYGALGLGASWRGGVESEAEVPIRYAAVGTESRRCCRGRTSRRRPRTTGAPARSSRAARRPRGRCVSPGAAARPNQDWALDTVGGSAR